MPIHDLLCVNEACSRIETNVYIPLADIDEFNLLCADCGALMDYDLRNKRKRTTRSLKFQEFRLLHTTRLDGTREGREIRSLADIRAFEKEHQDSEVCVEAFSYDSEHRVPEPQNAAPPEVMTAQQKRDFVEKYRAMDIKNERSARDYE